MDNELLLAALSRIAQRAESQQPFAEDDLGGLPGLESSTARERCLALLERLGLFLPSDEAGGPPYVPRAGHQFLDSGGRVDDEILRFLPGTIDDLHARAALLTGGSRLVHSFRDAVIAGEAVGFARSAIAPTAFHPALDEALATDLFAAAVALMARLSGENPAGCVAEEIVAVRLVVEAKCDIETARLEGELSDEDAAAAESAVDDLFDLFDDDDVYFLFQMHEPGDAALAEDGDTNEALGVVDQRLISWFAPFTGAAPTGHEVVPTDVDL